jgi:CDP-diacylglycerol pyrophosphatase
LGVEESQVKKKLHETEVNVLHDWLPKPFDLTKDSYWKETITAVSTAHFVLQA